MCPNCTEFQIRAVNAITEPMCLIWVIVKILPQSHNSKIEGACLTKEREESDANSFPTIVWQRHSVTSLETARSLANGPSWGGGVLREKYVFCIPRELQHLLSLFCLWEESMGGGGEILFTGRQTCSIYLVGIMTVRSTNGNYLLATRCYMNIIFIYIYTHKLQYEPTIFPSNCPYSKLLRWINY